MFSLASYNDHYYRLLSFGLSHDIALATAYPDGYKTQEEIASETVFSGSRSEFDENTSFVASETSTSPSRTVSVAPSGESDPDGGTDLPDGSPGPGTDPGTDGGDAGGGTTDPTEDPATEEIERVSILSSREMTWYRDPKTGRYYVGYGLPGSDREMLFEAEEDQMTSIFGPGNYPSAQSIEFTTLVRRANVTFAGSISEMEGTGTFEDEFAEVIALALDEGTLPEWASQSAAVMDIIYIAQAEEKSAEWVVEQIAKTPEFEQRFPGLNALTAEVGGSISDAVSGFLEFESSLKQMELASGGSAASVTPETVGKLLTGGYNIQDVQTSYQVWTRYERHLPALNAFNEILVANGGPALDEDGMYQFLEGTAPAEIYNVYEAASFREEAIDQGIDPYLDADYALQLAYDTPGMTSEGQIQQSLQRAAQGILRMRADLDLGRYGLEFEDLVDLSLGVSPRSGTALGELTETVNRAALEARANTQERARPFFQFTSSGRARTASLAERPTF